MNSLPSAIAADVARRGRRRSLAAIITCISVVGLSLGMTVPLISLLLERQGVDSRLIGLMAAIPAVGVFLTSPRIPSLVRAVGVRGALLGALTVAVSTLLLLPLFSSFWIWLLLRLLLGAADAVLFVLSETWINQVAEERSRGRSLALYATALSLAMACGPLLLILTGTEGALPFWVAASIMLLAIPPLILSGGSPSGGMQVAGFGLLGFMRIAPTLCSAVLLYALLDACGFSLLPLFGLRHGFDETTSALMVTALLAGITLFQLPIGWLADRVDRERLLGVCGVLILVGSLALPWAVQLPALLWPTLLLLGGAGGGSYTVALILVGQRFRGQELVSANATFGIIWGVGNLSGPLLGGTGMALLNPDGMAYALALAAAVFLGVFYWRRHGS